MFNMKKSRKAFTLVELVVVILVIAILAAAIFLGGATVIKQARESQVKSDLNNMATYVQDMLYELPELQYFKGTAGQAGAYGTQESYTFDTKNDAYAGGTNHPSTAVALTQAQTKDTLAPMDADEDTGLPVLTLLNRDYMTDDFQIGDATRDAWDVPYLWSYDMSPSIGSGDPASCIIVINSMGVNSLDETSDASATTAAGIATGIAEKVIADLGTAAGVTSSSTSTNVKLDSATAVVDHVLKDANGKWLTADDYGVIIVMIDGQVSTAYYGF